MAGRAGVALLAAMLASACGGDVGELDAGRDAGARADAGRDAGSTCAIPTFGAPEAVTITGYDADAMEPFYVRDGQWLLFNDSNAPGVNTNLHYAEPVDALTFTYRGEIAGVNSAELDGVASVDDAGALYFVTLRSYGTDLSTLYRGTFADGSVTSVERVEGISRMSPGWVNFDAEISPDGQTLYFVDGRFEAGSPAPVEADLVIARASSSGFEIDPESDALLAAVNTDQLEYAPALTRDGLELYFTRLDPDATPLVTELFVTVRSTVTDAFCEAVRIDAAEGFVEGATLAPGEDAIYYHGLEGDRFVLRRLSITR